MLVTRLTMNRLIPLIIEEENIVWISLYFVTDVDYRVQS